MMQTRSLEVTLLIRIALVLSCSFGATVLWLWIHFEYFGRPDQPFAVHQALIEFFTDIFWSMPVILLVTIGVTALTLRQSFRPLRAISSTAMQIEPNSLHQRLPTNELSAEIVPLVAAINNMLQRIETGYSAQKKFAENAAHELRTPLQILSASLEDAEQTDHILALRSDLQRMSRSVKQILSLSRLEAMPAYSERSADLNQVSSETLSYMAPLAVRKSIGLSLEKPDKSVLISGNPGLIGDLLRNLVENAMSVSPVHSEVKVVITELGELLVIDQGPGIPDAYKAKAFERFWRLPNSKEGGTGLGLSIVKEIAERCEAQVSIQDANGGGAVFNIQFRLSND